MKTSKIYHISMMIRQLAVFPIRQLAVFLIRQLAVFLIRQLAVFPIRQLAISRTAYVFHQAHRLYLL